LLGVRGASEDRRAKQQKAKPPLSLHPHRASRGNVPLVSDSKSFNLNPIELHESARLKVRC
jgi:hypothetical protein